MYIILSVLGLAVVAFGFAFAAERQNKLAAISEIMRKRHIIEAQREQLESIKEMLRNARSQEDEARAEAAALRAKLTRKGCGASKSKLKKAKGGAQPKANNSHIV